MLCEPEYIPRPPAHALATLIGQALCAMLLLWSCQPQEPAPEAGATDDVWRALGGYRYVDNGTYRWSVVFSDTVQALHGSEVELQGFIIPIDQGPAQNHFLLSVVPVAGCQFCVPGGPETFVEVKTEQPITFSYDPITLRGPLTVLTQDEIDASGMYYRMTDPQKVDE